jgi:hypothetical protein
LLTPLITGALKITTFTVSLAARQVPLPVVVKNRFTIPTIRSAAPGL